MTRPLKRDSRHTMPVFFLNSRHKIFNKEGRYLILQNSMNEHFLQGTLFIKVCCREVNKWERWGGRGLLTIYPESNCAKA